MYSFEVEIVMEILSSFEFLELSRQLGSGLAIPSLER